MPGRVALFFTLVIDIDFSVFAFLYVSAGMATILGLWFYYDRRDKLLYDRVRIRTTFHCIQCGTLYTEQGEHNHAACPHCGFENAKLKF